MKPSWIGPLAAMASLLSCSAINDAYDPDAVAASSGSTGSGMGSGSGGSSEPDGGSGDSSATTMPGDGGSSSSSDDGDVLECLDPGGALFQAGLPPELQQMYCGSVLEMDCFVDALPGGQLDLIECAIEGDPIGDVFVELAPVTVDPGLDVIADQVVVRAAYDPGMECSLRFIEVSLSNGVRPAAGLLFAGGTLVPQAAEMNLLDVVAKPDTEARCECEQADCCVRQPGEYEIAFQVGDGGDWGVTIEEGSVEQLVGEERYEGHNLRAFRGPRCDDRLEAHWVVRRLAP